MKNLLVFVAALIMLSCQRQASTKLAPQEEQTARGGKPKPPPPNNIPAPTGLTVDVVSSTTVNIKWDAVTNAQGYWIYRNGYVPAIMLVPNYVDTALKAGTTYTYQIAAVVNTVLGPKSNPVTITTPQ